VQVFQQAKETLPDGLVTSSFKQHIMIPKIQGESMFFSIFPDYLWGKDYKSICREI